MRKIEKKSAVSRVVALMLVLTMVTPLFPTMEVSAGDPGLVDTQSIVYNKGSLYNYSDSYYKDGKLREDDLIEGKGDFNEDLREIAYAQDPDAPMWEGLYFGSGNTESQTLQIPGYERIYNIAKDFTVTDSSSGDNEMKDGDDGLWNDDTETKAWTTWDEDNNRSENLTITSNEVQEINQIKLYFLNNETNSTFTDNITIEYRRNTYGNYSTLQGDVTSETSDDGFYRVVTIDLNETSVRSLRFTFTTPNARQYIMLTEIELFGTETETINSVTKDIALYNIWPGNRPVNQIDKRAYIYSGLAKEQLVNGQIQFNVPDGGLFTNDTSNKEVYTNIGFPFIYDAISGYYEFNAGPQEYGGYGIHFDANYDGVITEAEKVSGSNMIIDGNHFYAYDIVNNNRGADKDGVENQNPAGDGIQGFFPFNSPQSVIKAEDQETYDAQAEDAVYHFGANISVDFRMTADGTVDGNGGEAITFDFYGDDDVWVYIDGQLVLDLGGIHDSVSAQINFKENKITMWSTNEAYGSGDMNEANSGIVGSTEPGHVTDLGQILNSENGTGKITKSYDTFSEEGDHTLTIFYLERGRGESNCRIRYNLPRVDTLDVTKSIQLAEGETEEITDEEWDALNAIDFKMRVLDGDQVPVDGRYALYESSVYVGSYYTDKDGYFTLKNNQTAKFTMPLGASYVIEEVATEEMLPAAIWKTTRWTGTRSSVIEDFAGAPVALTPATSTNDTTDKTEVHTYSVATAADLDAIDTVSINCTNYISRPFVSVTGETIVIDYGLPVKIDIMGNDVQSNGKQFIINGISAAKYGTIRVLDKEGNAVDSEVYTKQAGYYYLEYTPTTYLSDMEKITYTYKVVDSNFSGGYTYPTGVATVIPATSMYYEENFLKADGGNYIKFSTAKGFTGFTETGTAVNEYQEPGVVGTLEDSTYGTDVAYLTGAGDSNGTSYKADTTNGPAAFQYTFTGTGTAFFARTSEKSGYLRVSMKDSSGANALNTTEEYMYIDTKYAVAGKELYNIPVFNIEDLPYDTYTVTVTVAKPSQWYTNQNEFYLDGVRVYDPIDMSAESEYSDIDEVYAAYEKDLEADANVNTIRNYMLDTQTSDATETGWKDTDQIMFTDTNGEIVLASEYESIGPKQELYMTEGQSIRFVLSNWFDEKPTNAKLYIGAKVPDGIAGTFTVNGKEYEINNTTDCYYDITSAITAIEGSTDGFVKIVVESSLISLTNLKCTGFVDFSFAGMDDTVEGPVGGQTVFTLLKRSVNEDIDVPSDDEAEEDTNTPSDDVVEEKPENPSDTEDSENEDTAADIGAVIVTIVKKVTSFVKSIFSKWFR